MRKHFFTSILVIAFLTACSGGVQTTSNDTSKTYTFGTPTNFSVTSLNKDSVVVSYDYNGAVDGGYKIYYGETTALDGFVSLPNAQSPYPTPANSVTIQGLPEGKLAYFAATALKADGSESAKTSIISITPIPLAAGQKQHTVHAQIEACVSELDKVNFKQGLMVLADHKDGSDYPGQGKDCDIDGIRLHTTEIVYVDDDNDPLTPDIQQKIERVVPALGEPAWAPDVVGRSIDLAIYKIVTTLPMTITKFTTISTHCVSIGTSKVEAKLENDDAGVPNTVVMDATDCASNDGMNFLDGAKGRINFDLTYTAADAQ